jgi:hypothetical protein
LNSLERSAIEAVARRCSARWEPGRDPRGAYLIVAGKRIAVDIRTLKRRGTGEATGAKPRLRFDRVATRLIERLRAGLGTTVPRGITVLLSVTAPIRRPSKTAASLEYTIRTLLGRRAPRRDTKHTIHGNRVRIRFLRHEPGRAPPIVGFVHSPDSDPTLLFDMTHELLELLSAEAGRRARSLARDRWLVGMTARGSSCLAGYRDIYSQLHMANGFKRIFLMFGDGSLGVLTG